MRTISLLFLVLALPAIAAPPAKPPVIKPFTRTLPKPTAPIDQLFAMLARAPSEEDAKPVEEQIMAVFEQSGSATVDLLMTRSAAALEGGDKNTASQLIDSITNIAPDFAEGWHRRAALQEDDGDDEGALISLHKTVTLNPREFDAYAEMGAMLEDYGDKKAALDAFRHALILDPKMEGGTKHVDALSREVEGEKI